jgi:hypothetical protein
METSAMVESHPFVGLAGALVFAVIGVVGLLIPGTIQRIAQRVSSRSSGKLRPPFVSFVDSPYYVPALRLLAVMSLLIAGLLAVTSLIELSYP